MPPVNSPSIVQSKHGQYNVHFPDSGLVGKDENTYDVQEIRREFPILERQVNGHPLIYLDSAASSQKPRAVIESQREYLSHFHSNIHRGAHALATQATEAFEGAREIAREYFNASKSSEIVFTSGAFTVLAQQ